MSQTRATILLVEDDESLREVLAMNLEDYGFEVEQFANGTAAIEAYDPARHELVLTDLRMPGISGLDVLDHVKEREPDAVVLVLTAYGGAENSLEAMRRGAFHYVEKPVNTLSLVQEIERALADIGLTCGEYTPAEADDPILHHLLDPLRSLSRN